MLRIYKDRKHGVFRRNYGWYGHFYLTITVLTFFDLQKTGEFLPEKEMWELFKQEQPVKEGPDSGFPKLQGEFFIHGHCFPSAQSAEYSYVKAQIGSMEKSLIVWGERFWNDIGPIHTISQPQPFESMPLTYQKTFGGESYTVNPYGRGYPPSNYLPNVELTDDQVFYRDDKPKPATFLPLWHTHPWRIKDFGTYDTHWAKHEWPFFARDLQWRYFNAAPADQQQTEYFQGNEQVSFQHMHPNAPTFLGQLPGLNVRAFGERVLNNQTYFFELPMNLDTLWFFPHQERGIEIWHGTLEVSDDEGSEVLRLLTAHEPLTEPQPVEYYQKKLKNKAERQPPLKSAIQKSKESAGAAISAPKAPKAPKSLSNIQKQIQGAKQEIDKATQKTNQLAQQQGINVESSTSDPYQGMDTKQMIQSAQKKVDEVTQKIAQHPEASEQAKKDASGSSEAIIPEEVTFQSSEEYQALLGDSKTLTQEEAAAIDAIPKEYKKMLKLLEKLNKKNKLKNPADNSKSTVQQNASQQGANFSDLDLSELDLNKYNFANCFFKNCNLTKTKLDEANFEHTTFKNCTINATTANKATLKSARFIDCTIQQSQFKEADLTSATFHNCDLSESQLVKMTGANIRMGKVTAKALICDESKLPQASFFQCQMANSQLNKIQADHLSVRSSQLTQCQLNEAALSNAEWHSNDMRSIQLIASDLTQNRMTQCELSHAQASEATMCSSRFHQCTLDSIDLTQAKLNKFSLDRCEGKKLIIEKANLTNSRLTENKMTEIQAKASLCNNAYFKGCQFNYSNFRLSQMAKSLLYECTLQACQMDKCYARHTRMIKCDLSESNLQYSDLFRGSLRKTILKSTNLSYCNLYNVDFYSVVTQNTNVYQALFKKDLPVNFEEMFNR